MISIKINNSFIAEKQYITDIIFGEFLGIAHNLISVNGQKNYEIIIENGNKLIIRDYFFGNFQDNLSYLSEKNITDKVNFTRNQFLPERDIPVIFGNDELVVSHNKIICGIDIFASSFFMLTRWEEYANKIRDKHNRFPARESLAYKSGFLDRPIVNEYVEMLWNMLVHLGYRQPRKQNKFNLTLTHDIDVPMESLKFNPLLRFLRHRKQTDKLDSFRNLFKIAERLYTKSFFFFITSNRARFDPGYSLKDKFIKELLREIHLRGHAVGFHPGYYTYNNPRLWEREYKNFSEYIPYASRCGRQHYLRFEVPKTWQIWEDNGMEWDSTLGYPEEVGFRCGTCSEFSVFNVLTRKKLNLKEKPLVAMDTTFWGYQAVSPEITEEKIKNLILRTKKYNGDFVILWHNSSPYPYQHSCEKALIDSR